MKACIFWLVQDLSDVPEGDTWLSEREREILSRLLVPKRRDDWRLGRWTAKQASCALMPAAFPAKEDAEIIAGEDGAPDIFLPGGLQSPVSISVSHSNGRGLCGIEAQRRPIGCDLERIERKPLDFFEDYFTREETAFCGRQSAEMYPIACYLVWSAKETCLKILREGLRRDTRSVQVDAEFQAEGGIWQRWTGRCRITSRTFHGWWKHDDRFMYALGSDRPTEKPVLLKTSKV